VGIDTLTKILRTFLDQSVLIFCSSATRAVVVVEVVATLLLLYATNFSCTRYTNRPFGHQRNSGGSRRSCWRRGAKEVWDAVDTSSQNVL